MPLKKKATRVDQSVVKYRTLMYKTSTNRKWRISGKTARHFHQMYIALDLEARFNIGRKLLLAAVAVDVGTCPVIETFPPPSHKDVYRSGQFLNSGREERSTIIEGDWNNDKGLSHGYRVHR